MEKKEIIKKFLNFYTEVEKENRDLKDIILCYQRAMLEILKFKDSASDVDEIARLALCLDSTFKADAGDRRDVLQAIYSMIGASGQIQ